MRARAHTSTHNAHPQTKTQKKIASKQFLESELLVYCLPDSQLGTYGLAFAP